MTRTAVPGVRMLRRLRSLLGAVALVAAVFAFGESPAHAAKFTSYYNYPGLDWYVIQTEHFNVFYPVSKKTREQGNEHYVNGEWSARKTALVAEEMYPKICGQFNFYLKETVNIVMLEYLDELEGYTVPNWDWIVISTHHSDLLWRWRGHHDWLRVVLYHEYAHVVSLKAEGTYAEEGFGWYLATRWFDVANNTDVGAEVFVSGGPPWFWVEGGAEYYTDTAGINNWSSNRDMFMRMDILQGTLLTLGDMQDYYGANGGFDGERHYNEGYNFALYLEEKFGQGVYQSFALNRSKKGWEPDWMSVIEDTLHVSADELYEGWKQWATEKYERVEAEVMKAPAIGEPLAFSRPPWDSDDPQVRADFEKYRKLEKRKKKEADGRHNLFQQYSPDGRYFSSYDYFGQITVQEVPEDAWPAFSGTWGNSEDAEVAKERQKRTADLSDYLGGIPAASQYDWKPDGSGIVFVCPERLMGKFARKTGLFANVHGGFELNMLCTADLYEKKKGKETQLAFTEPVHIPGTMRPQDPAISPDGKSVAFSRFEDGTQNLIVVDLATGEPRQLTHWKDGNRVETIDWSPDGRQLVFGGFRQNQADVYVIDVDGTGLTPITFDKYEDRDVHWGHDGYIYFSSDRVGGIFNIFRHNPYYDPKAYDSDRDGLVDAQDKCIDDPETVNGIDDQDGCPDASPARLDAERKEIVITEQVFFDLDQATIKPESYRVLDAVASILRQYPDVKSLEIQGHTDDQGNDAHNLKLSQARAEAVRTYVSGVGIDPGRLGAKGYGKSVPLIQGADEAARAKNRRVQFMVLQRDETVTPVAVAENSPEPVVAAPMARSTAAAPVGAVGRARLVQVSNVVGGAFTPWLTPQGNIVYSGYTAFGWKGYGLPRHAFLERIADDAALDFPLTMVKLDVQEEIPSYQAQTSEVKTSGIHIRPPFVVPIIDVQADLQSHMGVNAGIQLLTDTYLDDTSAYFLALFGEVTYLSGGVTLKHLWPNVSFFGTYGAFKYDYGFFFDRDENTATTDDQFTGDLKNTQYLVVGGASVDVPLNPNWQLEIGHISYSYGFRGTSEGNAYDPYAYKARNTISTGLNSFSDYYFYSPRFRINPRGGRRLSLAWSVNYSKNLYAATNGLEVDDYQYLDDYWYNEVEFGYAEYIPIEIRTARKSLDHTLQLDFRAGFVDRNVGYSDEFRAGGGGLNYARNPWQSNSLFSGFPPYSLAGETMIMLNAAYRFPLFRDIDKKVGILYLDSLYAQFFGTAGNLWSYRLRDGAKTESVFSDHVALDPDDVRREIPFVDKASQNGNYLLFDAGLEVRLSANLFNRSPWDCYMRLAYGFNKISGLGDVDGDNVYSNTDDPNINTNSAETEPAGLRFFVGIGTGW